MKLVFYLILFYLSVSAVTAQLISTSKYHYQVLIDNPTAFVNHNPIDIGRYLEPGSVIEIDTGLVVLVDPDGNTIELKGPIKQEIPHKIVDLEDWNESGFSHLLKSKIRKVKYDIAPTAFVDDFSAVNLIGRPFYLSSFRVLKSDSIRFLWEYDTLKSNWTITLQNIFSELFFQTKVQNNHVSIPLGSIDEELLVVSIAKTGERYKKSIGLEIIEPDSIPAITTIDHLILALRYEAQFDWELSDFHFEKAMKLANNQFISAIKLHEVLRNERRMAFEKSLKGK